MLNYDIKQLDTYDNINTCIIIVYNKFKFVSHGT